ncbi:MAG: hypothetical protein KatS3mg125_1390 [Lysobacterales bacterium]|jgi:phage FluMu gp28-like protein|nr:MAG: hypothetical protein KatS3mg125_1390 [Xanthomonadales bacterium]
MAEAVLFPYQRRYLLDRSRWKAACWARQTGKTFTTTLEAVLDALEGESQGKPRRWTILSVNRDRALDAMDNGVKRHLRAIGCAFEALDQQLATDELAHIVRFPGGSYIRAIAAKPANARGMSDNLILDEFAHHQDNRALWQALAPVVSRPDLKVRVISTPNGVGDMFHAIMSTGLGGLFSRHTVTIHTAVREGLPRDIEELRRAMGDPDAFQQEFECVFLDHGSCAWLSFEEILAALNAPPLPPYDGRPCLVGMDIAARADLTVIAVLEDVGADVLVLRELIKMRGQSFAAQLAALDQTFRRYHVIRAAIDQTGMGEMPVEEARRRHGRYRVEGVLFTPGNKLELAVALKDRLQNRRLILPVPEHERQSLIDELRSVKMERGTAGIPRLVADRGPTGHGDVFWALALACAAASSRPQPDVTQWASVGPRPTAFLFKTRRSTNRAFGLSGGVPHG